MNKIILLFLVLFSSQVFSQNTVVDTANFPYWVEMMQNPNVNFFQTQRAFEIYWKDRPIERGSGFKPFKRWEYSTSEIVDSKGNIPKPGQLEAIVEAYIQSINKGGTGGGTNQPGTPGGPSAFCLTDGEWTEIGPRKLAGNRTSQPNGLGRINALGFHPSDSNIIYIGTPAGGLWTTLDGGLSWSSNTDTLATLGVSSIAVDPFSPDTIYIGTGDRDAGDSYGRGVMRSLDGGKTWKSSNTGMGNAVVGRLVADPKTPGVLIAGTSSGVYRSTNFGANWTRSIAGNFKELTLHSNNSNIVFAATYATASFYRSTDNGVSFTKITSGVPNAKRRMAIAVTPHDTNFVYLLVTNSRTFEGLYLSTDKGLNFTRRSNTPNIMDYSHLGSGTSGQAWYDLDMAADPNDKSSIYVGGVNIFKSTDSGKTWKINAHWVGSGGAPAIHADQHILEYGITGRTLFVGNDGGFYFTTNGGSSWTDRSTGIGNAQIYRLGQSNQTRDMVINGYQDNGTGLFENGSWFTIMGGDGMDCVIDPTTDEWAYSDLYYGDVRRFRNGRYNKGIAKNGLNGITESGGWITPFILREGSPKTMYIGYKNVWRTTDCQANTVSWNKISNSLAGTNSQNITHLENSPANSKILYVSRGGNTFFRSNDADAASPTWTNLTSTLPNNSSVRWIEAHSTQANKVWICQSNKVYQSTDYGASWTNISTGLPNIPIMCLVYDSSSKKQALYAGTYMGVFYKDTTMSSWTWYNNGMPTYTRVRDVEIYYSPAGRSKSHVICATYGRGNWRSPLYDEDQKAPIAGFDQSALIGCTDVAFQLSDTSENNPTRWKWEIRPSSVQYLNGTDSCSPQPELVFKAEGLYSIKLIVDNCAGIDSISKTQIIDIKQAAKPAVCTGITRFTSQNIGIYTMSIDTFNHNSKGTRDEGAYLDLSCTEVFTLKSDTSYNVNITTGLTWNENVKVFIDFNDNGRLDDAGEMVVSAPFAKVHNVSVAIPSNPVFDKVIRMRVMSDYDTIVADPCDTLRYGQTHDFGLIIKMRVPEPDFVVDKDSVCINEVVMVTDSSEGSIVNRKWYFGPDASLDSAVGIGPHFISFSSPGFKKIQLLVNDGFAEKTIDSIIFVKQTPNLGLNLLAGTLTGCENRDWEFSVQDSNTLASSFSWYRGNTLLSSSLDTFYKITNATLSDSGDYWVTANFQSCPDTSTSLGLKVDAMPTVSFTVNTDSQCFRSNNLILTNTGNIQMGTFTSEWDFGDNQTSSSLNSTHSYTADGLFEVKLKLVSDKLCADSASKMVRIWPNPSAGFSIDDDKQCFEGNKFRFTNTTTLSSGNFTNNWDFGNGITSTQASDSQTYSTVNVFQVRLIATSDNTCSDTVSLPVTVDPSPRASFIVNNANQCLKGHSYDFTNNSTISSGTIGIYAWDFGGIGVSANTNITNFSFVNSGTYDIILSATSDQSCTSDTTIQVSVYDDPVADFDMNSGSMCITDHSISFTNNSVVSSGSITVNNWDFGDGTTSASASPPNKKYVTDGTYSVVLVVRSDRACADTLSKDITIAPSPIADFVVTDVCLNDFSTFTNNSSVGVGSLTSDWDFGNSITSTLSDPQYKYPLAGVKTVRLIVTSTNGCVDTLIQNHEVYPLPIAGFTHAKVGSFGTRTDMQFSNGSSADVNTWLWDFGNATSSIESDPMQSYQDTGSFIVRLIVSNAFNCYDTTSQSIFVFPETIFHLTNSFSPNGDGLNDEFKIEGLEFVTSYSMRIYTRWGEKVFESNDPNIHFTGELNNELLPMGSYLFVVEFTDLKNEKYLERGEIFLIR